MTEQDFVSTINRLGGKVYIVGGWVRDTILQATPKDKDYVITGVGHINFSESFPMAKQIGRSFPVFLLEIEGDRCEIAFARMERKTGVGYNGFKVQCDPSITIEQDLFRRDTTMNSIAMELPGYKIVDPYDGQKDIKLRVINATSEVFKDDPVRALRAARQAAELDFSINQQTLDLMSECREELKAEPKERFFKELNKVLNTDRPSLFFRYLQKASLLETVLPEIYALLGKRQPIEYHPEGDAFEHTMQIIDWLAGTTLPIQVKFAGLMHDIGKGLTPEDQLPRHINHDINGLIALDNFAKKIPIPTNWRKSAEIVIKHHMRVNIKQPKKIVELLLEIVNNPIGMNGFRRIVFFDSGEIPMFLLKAEQLLKAINSIKGINAPEYLQGKEIGDWILQHRCMKVSAIMKG